LDLQLEEEKVNGGEQYARNKVDGYKVESWTRVTSFSGILLWLRNSFGFISKM